MSMFEEEEEEEALLFLKAPLPLLLKKPVAVGKSGLGFNDDFSSCFNRFWFVPVDAADFCWLLESVGGCCLFGVSMRFDKLLGQ